MEVATAIVENTTENDNDSLHQMNALSERIRKLEADKESIAADFNVQRARMKELFLQKEEELNRNATEKLQLSEELKKLQVELGEARSQLLVVGLCSESNLEVEKRKAQEEMATLQKLFDETVEESSSSRSMYDTELCRLQHLTQQLQAENNELRQHSSPRHAPSELSSGSLAPGNMLNVLTKTVARKLGADSHSAHENLEESMRKAQEETEMLRSLVMPLEEEIRQLKDKLRTTDEQLQHCRLCGHAEHAEVLSRLSAETSPIKETDTLLDLRSELSHAASHITSQVLASSHGVGEDDDGHSTGSGGREKASPTPCDMCNNYETQLVQEQQNVNELEMKLGAAEKSLERQKDDLLKEINFRKEMEEKWNEKKEEHKEQVAELNKRTLCAEQDLQELRQTFEQTYTGVQEELARLTSERERVKEHLTRMEKENDSLVGKHMAHSQKLQSEMIDLPSDVEELQLVLLRSHEDLIAALVSKENAIEQQDTLRCEVLMRDQTIHELGNLAAENEALKKELHRYKQDTNANIELQRQLADAARFRKQLEDSNGELKSRVSSLQQDLDNSEQVQKDFVRLSQSLQVELEKIRGSDTQVRWQHEEDVDECPLCRCAFTGPRKKLHCRHCGQIFCSLCLTHAVPSGPNQRPSKVCNVCHTLLNQESAPYFSTEAPHSPD